MTPPGTRRARLLSALLLVAVVSFSGILFARSAEHRPFWYDELLTTRLSELPLSDFPRALTAGFELNPPLMYLAVRAARVVPSPEMLTARLPSLLGYALLTATLFLFLKRRTGPWTALAAAALVPLTPYAITYAVEARAYMALLGVSGLALLCWQRATDEASSARLREWGTIGLALAVAAALLLHVWAILLPLALLVGELVAVLHTGRIRWRVIFALAAAAPALLIYPPLLRSSHGEVFAGPVYAPTRAKLIDAFESALPRLRVILGLAGVVVVTRLLTGRRAAGPTATIRAEELAVFSALLVSPLIPYVYAVVAHGAFMTRYGLFAVPGAIGLIGAGLGCAGGGRSLTGGCAALVALLGVGLYLPAKVVPDSDQTLPVVQALASMDTRLDPAVPIVLVNPLDVLPFDEQAPSALLGRVSFVADPDAAIRYTGTNSIDLGYVLGAPYLKMRIRRVSYADLTARSQHLYLAGKWHVLSWLPQRLRDNGWVLLPIGGSPAAPIFDARE